MLNNLHCVILDLQFLFFSLFFFQYLIFFVNIILLLLELVKHRNEHACFLFLTFLGVVLVMDSRTHSWVNNSLIERLKVLVKLWLFAHSTYQFTLLESDDLGLVKYHISESLLTETTEDWAVGQVTNKLHLVRISAYCLPHFLENFLWEDQKLSTRRKVDYPVFRFCSESFVGVVSNDGSFSKFRDCLWVQMVIFVWNHMHRSLLDDADPSIWEHNLILLILFDSALCHATH